MSKYISVKQEIELSDYIDIKINLEEHIDEIMKMILNDESLCEKIWIKAAEYKSKKNRSDLMLKYPEIKQYSFDQSELFLAIKDDGSYLIVDTLRFFIKERRQSTSKWTISIDLNNKSNKLESFIERANHFDTKINNNKQFTKIDGDFILKFRCI